MPGANGGLINIFPRRGVPGKEERKEKSDKGEKKYGKSKTNKQKL
jgi:hypothetical protein